MAGGGYLISCMAPRRRIHSGLILRVLALVAELRKLCSSRKLWLLLQKLRDISGSFLVVMCFLSRLIYADGS